MGLDTSGVLISCTKTVRDDAWYKSAEKITCEITYNREGKEVIVEQ